MPDLREMLGDGRVHVVDGAMGTMLYARGVFMNVCYDELNATDPGLVEEIHGQYVRAGAEIIETNTFGANPVKLSSYGLDERTEELNARAARLAVRAAAGRACVAGALGPLGIRVEPLGPTSLEEAREYFGRQVDGLLDGGVEGFFLETFSDLSEAEQAFRAVRRRCDLPVVVQATVGENCATSFGASAEQAARAAEAWGADAAGLNCSVGPAVILDGVERMAAATRLPLSAQPNAGLPRTVGDRKMYLAGPDYMAMYARRLIRAGARLVGGCCGTTPEHVRRIREEVAAIQPRTPPVRVVRDLSESPARAEGPPLAARSRLGARLAAGEFATAVRVVPPRGWDASGMLAECQRLAEAGADAAVVHEDPGAARMSASAAAARVALDGALEPVLHYTCRGRTLSGMIGDLLGAAASGAHNLLLATGDSPTGGLYPSIGADVDVDAVGLANVVAGLNAGVDPSGNETGEATRFVTGVVVSQGARDRTRELERFHWKADAGAHYAVTRSVFDADHLLAFLDEAKAAAGGAELPMLATVLLLESPTQAEFLQNEVPGVHVPNRVVTRMRRAASRSREHAVAEGVEVAREIMAGLTRHLAGVQVVAPLERAEAFVVELVGSLTRAAPAAPDRPGDPGC